MVQISKKGQILGESLSLTLITVLAIILMIVFFVTIKAVSSPGAKSIEELKQFTAQNAAMSSLKAYLATPVRINYNNQNITLEMAELIRLADIDSSYIGILQNNTHNIFDRVYGEKYSIDLSGKNSLMVFPPYASGYTSCEKIMLQNIGVTLCLK